MRGTKALSTLTNRWILGYALLFIFGLGMGAQECDYTTGLVEIVSTGGNNNPGYTTIYVLTDVQGTIISIADNPRFEISEEGFFVAYAINSQNESTQEGIEIGENINNVTSDCLDISDPYSFTVCAELFPCTHCLGERIELESMGGNLNEGFTTQYILTNRQGEILDILDEPTIDNLEIGFYLLFAINYETSKGVTGLEIGQNVTGIMGSCMDISAPFLIGVCDQITPSVFFDLQQCNISDSAKLIVDGVFDTYAWSTGSSGDFIRVPTSEPATYSVTVTLDNGCRGVGSIDVTGTEISSIGDFVWEDANSNGRQDSSESGINGVTINLYADFNRDGTPDMPNSPTCTTVTADHPDTGLSGFYEFTVYQNNYVIEFVAPEGFIGVEMNIGDDIGDSDIDPISGFTPTIAIGSNQIIDNIDAGFSASTAICGLVWLDIDGDGRRESGELGINDLTVNLFTSDGVLIRSTTTRDSAQEAGTYCFVDIAVQEYYVEVILPDGSILSPPNIGGDNLDSEGTGANGKNTTDIITTQAGTTTSGIDFGYYSGGTICGVVFRDVTGGVTGVYEEGRDSVIVNSLVAIIDPDTKDTISTAITGADGRYCAANIPVGSYQACFGVSPDRNSYVQQSVGDDPLVDSDVNTSTGKTNVFFVGIGETVNGINAGIRMGALPIEFIVFTGSHDRRTKTNLLNWSTAVEINNNRFEIERLINQDAIFQSIGTVQGSGTTLIPRSYSFLDKNASIPGNYYYRLKQIDHNGASQYSKIVTIKVGTLKSNIPVEDKFRVFPNPAQERIQLLIQSVDDREGTFVLLDMLGRTQGQWHGISLSKGDNLIELELRDVQPGNYILRQSNIATTSYQKIQIIK